jgi:hypothetical protein
MPWTGGHPREPGDLRALQAAVAVPSGHGPARTTLHDDK